MTGFRYQNDANVRERKLLQGSVYTSDLDVEFRRSFMRFNLRLYSKL